MWHTTYTQGNQGNSLLLVVKSQIGNLTPDLSFGHNLCFKYPKGPCEPILDIYVSKNFQWYNFFFNVMSFVPYNCPLKIRESIVSPTPKVGAHLRMCGFIPSHFPIFPGTWNVTLKLHSWLTPLQALALVASPRLRLWHTKCGRNNNRSTTGIGIRNFYSPE
jgi:hypothetical protein